MIKKKRFNITYLPCIYFHIETEKKTNLKSILFQGIGKKVLILVAYLGNKSRAAKSTIKSLNQTEILVISVSS